MTSQTCVPHLHSSSNNPTILSNPRQRTSDDDYPDYGYDDEGWNHMYAGIFSGGTGSVSGVVREKDRHELRVDHYDFYDTPGRDRQNNKKRTTGKQEEEKRQEIHRKLP